MFIGTNSITTNNNQYQPTIYLYTNTFYVTYKVLKAIHIHLCLVGTYSIRSMSLAYGLKRQIWMDGSQPTRILLDSGWNGIISKKPKQRR